MFDQNFLVFKKPTTINGGSTSSPTLQLMVQFNSLSSELEIQAKNYYPTNIKCLSKDSTEQMKIYCIRLKNAKQYSGL